MGWKSPWRVMDVPKECKVPRGWMDIPREVHKGGIQVPKVMKVGLKSPKVGCRAPKSSRLARRPPS